jgi:glycosyltransferase involved in cell wall biosynthesis
MHKLNIVSTTYNQQNFIKQTLDSFLMQKTDFDFNIIIADDCSTDNTSSIISSYAKQFSTKIKFIQRQQNLGIIQNYIQTLANVDAKYVIICEGDDYFTHKNKLQIQVDYLEKNPNKSICFHPVKIIKDGGFFKNIFIKKFPKAKKIFYKTTLNLNDILIRNFIQTNSAMYRWRFTTADDFLNNFPNNIMPCDHYLHMLHAQVGEIGFINKTMSAYRIWQGGTWFNSNNNIEKHILKHGENQLNFMVAVAKNIATDRQKYLTNNYKNINAIKEIFTKYNQLTKINKQLSDLIY